MINFISDVHIFKQDDDHAKVLFKFFDECKKDEITEIFLLGDIFDLLVGDHAENSTRYKTIFDEMRVLLSLKKKLWYFEGNHDLHLTDFFQKEFKEDFKNNFKLVKNFIELNRFNKKLYITHGDYLTLHDPFYLKYRKFASTKPMEILFEKFIPYWFINLAGGGYSKKSKKDKTIQFDVERAKKNFRKGADEFFNQFNPDYLIAGHSHIKDSYEFSQGKFYLNNGFAPKEQTYLQIDENGYHFRKL